MANYQSKYTGAEIDQILDNAIELPSVIGQSNKILGVNSAGTDVEWKDGVLPPSPGDSLLSFMYLKYNTVEGIMTWESIDSLISYLSNYFIPIDQSGSPE